MKIHLYLKCSYFLRKKPLSVVINYQDVKLGKEAAEVQGPGVSAAWTSRTHDVAGLLSRLLNTRLSVDPHKVREGRRAWEERRRVGPEQSP